VSAARLALSGGQGLTADEPARAAGPAAGAALEAASLRPWVPCRSLMLPCSTVCLTAWRMGRCTSPTPASCRSAGRPSQPTRARHPHREGGHQVNRNRPGPRELRDHRPWELAVRPHPHARRARESRPAAHLHVTLSYSLDRLAHTPGFGTGLNRRCAPPPVQPIRPPRRLACHRGSVREAECLHSLLIVGDLEVTPAPQPPGQDGCGACRGAVPAWAGTGDQRTEISMRCRDSAPPRTSSPAAALSGWLAQGLALSVRRARRPW
jgi:hypothetical protein